MTNEQFILAVAIPTVIPTLAVVISILRSDSKIEALRVEMNSMRGDFNSAIGALRADFNNSIGALRADMESMRHDLHADIRILNNVVYEHNGRLSKLEKL